MLRTAEIDMADSVTSDDVDVFLDNATWAAKLLNSHGAQDITKVMGY